MGIVNAEFNSLELLSYHIYPGLNANVENLNSMKTEKRATVKFKEKLQKKELQYV